jgi:hypothetical protein
MQHEKVGLLLWMLLESVGPSELELIRSCVDPLRQASLPRPTKGWPCETSGPEPFAMSSNLLVDPGDICPPQRGTGRALRRELGAWAGVVAEKSDACASAHAPVHGERGGGETDM